MRRLKAHANSAKHSAFMRNTGYTKNGAATSAVVMTRKATTCAVDTPGTVGSDRADVLVARRSHEARPKRPAGRSSSTTAMITKITVLEASG